MVAVLTADAGPWPPDGGGNWCGPRRDVAREPSRVRTRTSTFCVVPADPDPVPLLRRTFEQRPARGREPWRGDDGGRAVAGPAATRRRTGSPRGRPGSRRTAGPGGFLDVRELGTTALLLESGTPDAPARFADRLLGRSLAHDARRGGELVPTLRAWLAAGCSAPAAAAALVVHPNTVAYRLARVEQLTGRSLRRPDTRLELQLALTVDDVGRT